MDLKMSFLYFGRRTCIFLSFQSFLKSTHTAVEICFLVLRKC